MASTSGIQGVTKPARIFQPVPAQRKNEAAVEILKQVPKTDELHKIIGSCMGCYMSSEPEWQALAEKLSQGQPLPVGESAKTYVQSHRLIRSLSDLCGRTRDVFCRMKAGEKRSLSCVFLNPPGRFELSQGVGSRATPEGFAGPADEEERYLFSGDPETIINRKDGTREHTDVDGVRTLFSHINAPESIIDYQGLAYFGFEIDLDVGKDNLLGYCCKDDSLICADDPIDLTQPIALMKTGENTWSGRIPYGTFQFVKITPDGTVIPADAIHGWGVRCGSRPYSNLTQKIERVAPINFPIEGPRIIYPVMSNDSAAG